VGTYSSELWEPIFFVGIVGKSRFSSFLTLLSEFWEPPTTASLENIDSRIPKITNITHVHPTFYQLDYYFINLGYVRGCQVKKRLITLALL
jgi:hypothetical protein